MDAYTYYNNSTGVVKSKAQVDSDLVVTVTLKTGELPSNVENVMIPITFIHSATDMKTWYAKACSSTNVESKEFSFTFTRSEITISDELKYMPVNAAWELRLTAKELNDIVKAINTPTPIATTDAVGTVKIGSGLDVIGDGTVSVDLTWILNNISTTPAGAVMPFYNVTLGGTESRNPIFWGESEPDIDWLICDGGSDGQGGTVPDLRNKFIQGASGTNDAGQTGGAVSATPSVTVTGSSSQISVSATTLNVNQMPSHGHSLQAGNRYDVSPRNQISATDANITQTLNVVNAAGGSQAHTHGVTDSTHTHTATSSTVTTLPPFYKLLYCVKLPAA